MTGASLRGEDAWLADVFPALRRAGPVDVLALGLGDDAAVVRTSGNVVVTTDVLVDGVHFVLAECGPVAAARKALAVNCSDLAACGAEPLAFVVGGVLPRPVDRTLFSALMEGFAKAAEEFGCACAGGDTNAADGPLVLAVTALGRPGPQGVVTRDGARVGDVLSVTGPLGGSAAGRHLTFTPRVDASRALCAAGVPHAMMDLSDGLARDLPRLCRASGVGAVIDEDEIPLHPDAVRLASAQGGSALERALGDGEDFELLVAHAPLDPATRETLAEAGVVLTEVGRTTDARQRLTFADGRPFGGGGYDHLGA